MLRRAAVATVVAVMATACARSPAPSPPATPVTGPVVVARWSTDDGSVTAMNVVVPLGTDVKRLRALASAFRGEVSAGRLIVTIFASTAGPERFVIGHMPSGGEALIADASAAGWLARFDVP